VKQLRPVEEENACVRSLRSASTSETCKKIVSLDGDLVLPKLKDSNSPSV
jgi:hypothetical protein